MKKICVLLALFFIFPLIMFGCNESNNIKLRVKDGYIQYGYENEEEWENLLSLDELKQNSIENQNEQGLDFYLLDDGTYGVGIGNATQLSKIVIPEKYNNKIVTKIVDKGFQDCCNLTSIEIPNSVTSIGDSAFSYCDSLTSITIPNSVTSIGGSAFSNCDSLTSIEIPNSVTSIGNSAFYDCNNLMSVTIPDSVKSVGYNAFGNWSKLVHIRNLSSCEISNSNPDCEIITSGEFVNELNISSNGKYYTYQINNPISKNYGKKYLMGFVSKNLENNVIINDIPNDITDIYQKAFYECDNLTGGIIPNSVTSIGDYAFYNCDNLTSITIPNSVTSIGDYAFYRCDNLTGGIIPNSVTSIGDYAFYCCYSLTNITISNNVTSIGKGAFYWCKLAGVIIPNSVTSIGYEAFCCDSSTTIYCENNLQPSGWHNQWSYSSNIYWYSETQPIQNGNYWHYDIDGKTPVVWNCL